MFLFLLWFVLDILSFQNNMFSGQFRISGLLAGEYPQELIVHQKKVSTQL